MIANADEAREMTEHIPSDCKCKFNSAICNSNLTWNNKVTILEKSKLIPMIPHNVLIPMKSILNKDKNHCYYKIFLEKCSY